MHAGTTSPQQLLLAETLGLAMARRAADILDRHRVALAGSPPHEASPAATGTPESGMTGPGAATPGTAVGDEQFALDNAIFTAVLDAANECLGRFDPRPADDRWCDALLQVIHLGELARLD